MKPLGFLLLIAGWIIVLSAVMLLSRGSSQVTFVLAGLAVELMGLIFFVRSHATLRGEGR